MCAKRPWDASGDDSVDQPAGPPKHCRHHDAQHDEKYDAIFELLKKAEERSERIEMRAIENKKEEFEQAQQALDAYNRLSERIVHAIVNIGSSNISE